MISHFLRGAAIILILAAIVDPAITSERRAKPLVAIVVTDSATDAQLGDRVEREVARHFTVVRAPLAAAAASVIVGTRLPGSADLLHSPVFAVVPERAGAQVSIESITAPSRTAVNARLPIHALVRVSGAVGNKLSLSLRWGNVIVDRVERDINLPDELLELPLTFVPAAARTEVLRVEAQLSVTNRIAASEFTLDVVGRRWAILFFDRRPSWMSTFVKRALESDPRFVVSSRVVTSRSISSSTGQPPEALSDPTIIAPFDVIVTGSPDALGERDVAALDAFMRTRGGSTVLLMDQMASGPVERLTNVNAWSSFTESSVLRISPLAGDSSGLQASELAWPRLLPAGAQTIAVGASATRDNTPPRSIVWQSAFGAGRLVVSGALDSWRFRESERAAFEKFWRKLIAEGAEAAVPTVAVELEPRILRSGATAEVNVTVRDAALARMTAGRTVRTSVIAILETASGSQPVRLWPEGSAGRMRGTVRAPSNEGSYRVVVVADGARGEATLVVKDSLSLPTPDEREIVAAWANSRGGKSLQQSQLSEIVPALRAAIQPQMRIESWHPMRSPWWIVPLALALGGEWWLRRRRGLA